MQTNDFQTAGLLPELERALREAGFSELTPIQRTSIPRLLAGKDLIGQSKTGSGKTAAFVLPILQKLRVSDLKPQALILCPTREICEQVLQQCRRFSKHIPKLKIVSLVGGQPYPPQLEALQRGVHLVVGTPGRTLELLKDRKLSPNQIKMLVLDEADRLLEEGFEDEIKAIINDLPKQRQTAFFSATFPEGIQSFSRMYQKNAEHVSTLDQSNASSSIVQYIYRAEKPEKMKVLRQILLQHPSMCTIVFCRTKATVNEVGEMLTAYSVSSGVLHGDLSQTERDRAMALFRNGSLRVLVATDVAARGLDVDILELVVNYDLPSHSDIYVHRIGRTGRVERKGTAVSIATEFEESMLPDIESAAKTKFLYTELKDLDSGTVQESLKELHRTHMTSIQITCEHPVKVRADEVRAALLKGANALQPSELGRIDIHEKFSYVAVAPQAADRALKTLNATEFRGPKYKTNPKIVSLRKPKNK